MKTIGKNYEVSLQSALNNAFEFYVPLASQTMDCGTLTTNQQLLQNMVLEWQGKAESSANNTEKNNAVAIVQVLQGRLDEYDRTAAIVCAQSTPAGNGSPTVVTPAGTNEKSGSGFVLPLLLLGAGIFLVTRLKKKRRTVHGTRATNKIRKR